MNPKMLYVKDEKNEMKSTGVWACGKCGRISASEQLAEECCFPKLCSYCNQPLPERWGMSLHSECYDKRQFEQAERITEWNDFIYDPHEKINEGYVESLEIMLDEYDGLFELDELPAFVNPCIRTNFPGISVSSALENACCDMYDEAVDDLIDVDELQTFIKAWNEKQTVVSFSPNTKKIILIDRKKIWEECLQKPLNSYCQEEDAKMRERIKVKLAELDKENSNDPPLASVKAMKDAEFLQHGE